jgi:uncharacterized LabA/DUF88 family protein
VNSSEASGVPRLLIDQLAPFLFRDHPVPTMVFVDGENLTKRYQDLMKQKDMLGHLEPSQWYTPDVFLWSAVLNELCNQVGARRKHYYTSAVGSEEDRKVIEDQLKAAGIEAPYVFKRPKRSSNRPSKGVDISLAVDMLSHAHRKNYDLAILIAGDADYVPLVTSVKAEGSRVCVWFFDERFGLSRDLRMSADHYAEISIVFPF